MAERAMSRPWSEQEDALLRQAVEQYGDNENWKIIALAIPGRTNKACRKRWLHSLQPNIKKSAWTSSEDKLLLDLYVIHGPKWSVIARHIAGRTDDACSKRYREALDPSLKKDQWTPEEDAKLLDAYNRVGGKWGQVGQELQRSGLGCRNRWRLLERKKAARLNLSNSPDQVACVHEISTAVTAVEDASREVISPEASPSSQEPAVLEVHRPPYFPPEAYITLTSTEEEQAAERFFQVPTPPPAMPNPDIAPFQFSSSSLSAALSDPAQLPLHLARASVSNTPELSQDTLNEIEEPIDLSPLSQLPEMQDVLMSFDDPSQIPPDQPRQPQLQVAISQSPYAPDGFALPYPDSGFSFISPIIIPSEISQEQLFHDMWKVRGTEEFEFDSPCSVFDGLLNFPDGFSSSPSTPFFASNSLSPSCSPNMVPFVELPNAEVPSTGSLLLSPADGMQSSLLNRRPAKKFVSRRHKSSIKLPMPRLSSLLPLTNDHDIKPYACGRPTCWPNDQNISSFCFATSGELQEHSKDQHADENFSDKPYRCALAGCGKSWKSLNGLQYHLQISTVHFTNALHDKFSKQPATPVQQMSLLSTEGDIEDSNRRYHCPKPGCYKAYRQPSGLRYHIKHGHPPDLPTQLNFVPPALERQLPAKARKMRPKHFPDGTVMQFEQAAPAAN